MGIGHVAVGLALKRADRGFNVGWLIFAAFLPDFLLGWFAFAGLESYTAPNDYPSAHYLLFNFPWSHGLLAVVVWTAIAGATTWSLSSRRMAAAAVAVAVSSHFLLDGIVHVKGLPLAGTHGPAFGLGLWRHLPVELSIEAGMALLALFIYRSATGTDGSKKRIGMVVYIMCLTAFLIGGQAATTQVPERAGLIASWLAVPPAISAIAFWLDRRNQAGASQYDTGFPQASILERN